MREPTLEHSGAARSGNNLFGFISLVTMESLVITPDNSEDLSMLKRLLDKLHFPVRVLTDEEKEDIGLGILMMEADRNERVPREEIMAKLTR